MYELFCADNLKLDGKVYYIEAVRGIAVRNKKVLMLHSKKNGDYKLPGGKINIGEKNEKALFREVLEETGYKVLKEEELFSLMEYDEAQISDEDYFKMLSIYYKIEVSEEYKEELNLTSSEKEQGFYPVWVNIEKAYEQNKSLKNKNDIKWLRRETKVLSILIKNYKKYFI